MSRRVPQRTTVELFPFLAVLVCVMGALIFLLLVMTRQLRATAVAQATTEIQKYQAELESPLMPEFATELPTVIPESPAPQAGSIKPLEKTPAPSGPSREQLLATIEAEQQTLNDQWKRQVDQLKQSVAERHSDLNRQKLLANSLEQQIAAIRKELLLREAELAEMMGKASAADDRARASQHERVQLEQQILSLRQHLKQLADQQRDASSRYAVVPFDGKSGTTRRPLLIECRSTGIRFLPEDVTLSPEDFDGFTPQFNPLSAGTLALIQFWSRTEHQSSGEPYPMLIVRPDGTLAYYMAMKLLSGTRLSFGYELVTEDVILQMPGLNPEAKATLEQAIAGVMQQRTDMLAAAHGSVAGRSNQETGLEPGKALPSARNRQSLSGHGDSGSPIRTLPGASPGPVASEVSETGASKTGSVFSIADLEQDQGVGNRSWEDIDRFEGQEFRHGRKGRSADSDLQQPAGPLDPFTGRPRAHLPKQTATATPVPPVAQYQPTSSPLPAAEKTTLNQYPATGSLSAKAESDPSASARQGHSSDLTLEAAEAAQYPNFNMARNRGRGSEKASSYEQLRRRRWGSYEPGATIGIEREVLICVDADRMILGNEWIIQVPPTASREEVFHELVSSLDQFAHTWDKPAAGFFWIPKLKFVISPGGNFVYERVSPLVLRSGLASQTEFTLDKAAQAVLETQP